MLLSVLVPKYSLPIGTINNFNKNLMITPRKGLFNIYFPFQKWAVEKKMFRVNSDCQRVCVKCMR